MHKMERMKSSLLLCHINSGKLSPKEHEWAWAILSRRAHATPVSGAISSNERNE